MKLCCKDNQFNTVIPNNIVSIFFLLSLLLLEVQLKINQRGNFQLGVFSEGTCVFIEFSIVLLENFTENHQCVTCKREVKLQNLTSIYELLYEKILLQKTLVKKYGRKDYFWVLKCLFFLSKTPIKRKIFLKGRCKKSINWRKV